MKSNSLCIAAACLSMANLAFAGTNFNSATGFLVMPDLNIDGTAFYDSVTLKLNVSAGTFSIVSATPKNLQISDRPLQVFEVSGFTVGFNGCYRSGSNQITCYTTVTNSNNDAEMLFAARSTSNELSGFRTISTNLFDNLGTPYTGSVSVFGLTSGSGISGTVLQGVPVRVAYVFTNVDSRATSIAAFSPSYGALINKGFVATFRNISF